MHSGSNLEDLESALLKNRIDLARDKLEMMEVDAALEQVKTEAVYENQQLKVLAASTKPLDHGEKKTDRDRAVAQVMQESTKVVFDAVARSVDRQNFAADSADDMTRSIDVFFIDQNRRQALRIDHLNNKFDSYLSGLETVVQSSEDKLKTVTGQYLILRHNARIAREMLVHSRNQISREKQDIFDRIKQLRADVEQQLSIAEEKCEQQMNAVISQRRTELLRREEELENVWAQLEEKRNFHISDSRNLTLSYKEELRNFKNLTKQRTNDIKRIEGELKLLRQAVADGEQEILRKTVTSKCALNPRVQSRLNLMTENEICGLNNRLLQLKKEFKSHK